MFSNFVAIKEKDKNHVSCIWRYKVYIFSPFDQLIAIFRWVGLFMSCKNGSIYIPILPFFENSRAKIQ